MSRSIRQLFFFFFFLCVCVCVCSTARATDFEFFFFDFYRSHDSWSATQMRDLLKKKREREGREYISSHKKKIEPKKPKEKTTRTKLKPARTHTQIKKTLWRTMASYTSPARIWRKITLVPAARATACGISQPLA